MFLKKIPDYGHGVCFKIKTKLNQICQFIFPLHFLLHFKRFQVSINLY